MIPITIITTYYNEPQLLRSFVKNYIKFKKVYDNLSIIIVDDGSSVFPADQEKYLAEVPDLSLYKVTKDLGFNSHGARNLAMDQSKTFWNLMIDIDQKLAPNTFEELFKLDFNDNQIYELTVNTLVINKDVFFSCNGYDEELVNAHCGDRLLHNYLKEHFNFIKVPQIVPKFLRKSRKVEVLDIPLTVYENKKLYHPTNTYLKSKKIIPLIAERYKNNIFSTKKIINFDWVKVI